MSTTNPVYAQKGSASAPILPPSGMRPTYYITASQSLLPSHSSGIVSVTTAATPVVLTLPDVDQSIGVYYDVILDKTAQSTSLTILTAETGSMYGVATKGLLNNVQNVTGSTYITATGNSTLTLTNSAPTGTMVSLKSTGNRWYVDGLISPAPSTGAFSAFGV